MLVFVDESGDPGLKLDSGSSPYFVVVLVVFEDNEEADGADQRIGLLRNELGLHPDFEFHFNKCNSDLREKFLAAVAPYNFFYYGIVINKRKLWGKGFNYKESFYKYVSGLVFQNAKPMFQNATIVLDGNGSREFRKQMQTYLKKRINDPGRTLISKIKIQSSSRNNLLQLADMIAGALHRSFGSKGDANRYLPIVAHRQVYVQFWPK